MLIIAAALVGCTPREPPPSPVDSATDGPSSVWAGAVPSLDVEELTQGRPSKVRVSEAPPGATVTVWRGTAEGEGPCSAAGRCLGLVDPEAIAAGEIGPEGEWEVELDTADDAPTGAFLFQAEVLDVVEGWVRTDAVLRHVSVPAERAAVGFTLDRTLGPRGVGNTHTGGAAWIDYNGDFWPDLFVSNGAGGHRGLYRNEGDGRFTDVSYLVLKADSALEDAGALFGDIDNDGDSDLIVPIDAGTPMTFDVPQPYEGGPNRVYLNNGDGTFTESAAALGLVDPRGWRTSAAALADVDRDGFLDLWLGSWAMSRLPAGDNRDRLMMNRGGARFEEAAGFDLDGRDALVGLFFDAGRDGWPDLYVGNVSGTQAPPDYDATDQLYVNQGGAMAAAPPDTLAPGWGDEAWGAMGADVGDIDNDGDWDLYVTNVWLPYPPPRGNPLYLGDAAGRLGDNACDLAGICAGHQSWPTSFADLDRDGWVDLFVGTSWDDVPDLLFVNDRDGTFTSHRVASLQGNMARGGAPADFDGDGDLDLYLWRLYQEGVLLRNDARDDHHWIELKLIGTESNADAIGAEVALTTSGGPPQLRRVSGADSAHSQQDLVVHFGLGVEQGADVTVRWPSGRVDVVAGLPADRFHLLVEGEGWVREEIDAVATYDPESGTLEVQATSTLRGRSHLAVPGVGIVPWRAAELQYRQDWPVASDPGTIELRTGSGETFVVSTTAE
jgi:enediyne biosynthesis protein E4